MSTIKGEEALYQNQKKISRELNNHVTKLRLLYRWYPADKSGKLFSEFTQIYDRNMLTRSSLRIFKPMDYTGNN